MTRLRILLSAAMWVDLVTLNGCSSGDSLSSATPVPTVQVTSAETQSIEDVINAQGILYPIHQASLSPKISAPVEKFYVNRGTRVRKGQLLAILANKDLQAGVVSALGSYDQAKATYASTLNETLPEEIQKAEATVKDARSDLDNQQRVYESETQLYQEGAIARKQLDATAVALTAARNAWAMANQHLDNLQKHGAKRQREAARGQMEAAQGQYLNAEAQLGYTEIRSPIDGTVAERAVWPGDIAPAGTPLFVIMDVSQVVLRIHIPQAEATQLQIGDLATLQVPGIAEGVPARVSILSPALDPNSTTVEVWLTADNPDRKLAPGTSVGATIVVRTVPHALVVPESAILMDDKGQAHVMTVTRDNVAHDNPVVTGIHNNNRVQIVKGLQVGAQVIVNGAYGLPDNSKVKPEPAPDTSGPIGGQD